MKIKFLLLSVLAITLISTQVSAQNWNQIIKSCASDRAVSDNFGYSVAIDGNYAVVGAYWEDHDASGANTLSNAGSAYIFEFNGTTWTQAQKIVAPDRNVDDLFGASVSISGNYIVVGAYQEDENASGTGTVSNSGSAYVYKNNAGTWAFQQKICASDRFTDDFFGQSVAIDGQYIIVGAWREDENAAGSATLAQAGSAYVFKNTADVWTQTQKIVASDRAAADYFGWSVALSGNYAIIGAYAEDENSGGSGTMSEAGSAYIFLNTAGTFSQVQKIVPSDRAASDYFGYSVDIDNNYLIVGAYNEDEDAAGADTKLSAGSAYIFKNNAGTWSQLQKIVTSDRTAYDQFGLNVSISGSYAAIGANLEDHNEVGDVGSYYSAAGSAYIFKNTSDVWSQAQKICASDRMSADNFGFSVGISGNHAIVGANTEDQDANGLNIASAAGSVYFFRNSPEINVKQNVTNIASGDSYDFGSILYGNSSSAISFTIENSGGGDLNLTGTPKIDKSTGDVGAFTINQASVSSPVAPAGSTSFTVIYTPPAAGSHTTNLVIANDDSDENPYTIVLQGTGTLQDQTISNFNAIPTKTYGDVAFTVSATASSGLDVVFTSSNTSVATCTGTNGTTVTIVGAGTCEIRANQAGNAFYNPAPQVVQNLTVNTKTINVTADPQSKIYGDADPVLTYTYTPSLVGSDSFSGALTRVVGECGDCYAQIQQGTLSLGSNYTINYTPDDLYIAKRPLTVTVDAGQSKVYGTGNPTYTYTYTGTLAFSQTFSGSLTRTAGETVGLYPISQGTLGVNANYDITFVGANFEITAKPITVTANSSQTKTYGQSNPGAYSYTVTGTLVGADNFSGSLTRVSGEDVGLYEIQQGTLALSSNYNITYVPANFEITPKSITVVANNMQNKFYGDTDPTLTYWLMGTLETGDSFTGAISRDAGEDVGNYAITLGTLSAGSNYTLGFTSAQFQIKVKPITITVTAGQTKVYGQSDPAEFAYTTNVSIASWDSFTGALTRTAGENVGNYPITQGTLALNSNYNITFSGSNFAITAKALTVTADAGQTKVYGESDPANFTYTVTGSLESGDSFSGALVRDFGENIGIYEIEQGTLSAGSNYSINYIQDYFEITPRPISLIVDANQSKIYGDSDPELTFGFSAALVGSDTYSGALSREAGEDVGFYAISQGSVMLPNNYDVTFVPADFEIVIKDIIVTVEPNQTKNYGDSDPELLYSVNTSLAIGDDFTGSLTREAGENLGLYEISQGTLAINSNYNMSFVGDDFEIVARPIMVMADPDQSKIYGEDDPLEYTYTIDGNLVGGDEFTGALTREPGENAGFYMILQGDLALSANYQLQYFEADFEILKATPIISWENPADIYNNEALSATQLNATADVEGSFT
ncbi:MAG: MBG domain-containing protein, partial [Bacteroidales bacterium]|nr:MBG domain-containing protein [Bacteroidales bacterium]